MASLDKRQAFNNDNNSNDNGDGYGYGYGYHNSKEDWWWTPVSLSA